MDKKEKQKISFDIDTDLLENIVKEQGKQMNESGQSVTLTDVIVKTLNDKFGKKK